MLNFSQFGHWELIHSGFCVILKCLCILWASLVAQVVKNLPALWETWVRSLGWKDPLEEGMATHSSILARRIPWTEESGRLQSMGSQRVRQDRVTFTFTCFVRLLWSRSIFYFLCTNPATSHFFNEFWFPLVENGIEKQ